MSKLIRLYEAVMAYGDGCEEDEAKALIMAGKVVVNQQRIDKPGHSIRSTDQVRIKKQNRFVSRGGEKLFHALEGFGVTGRLSEAHVLDAGASTGGFTDCCLQMGAASVVAVDVGTNQLAWKLRKDTRVRVKEQTDIRALESGEIGDLDFIVGDLSFIGLRQVLPAITNLCSLKTELILLVKPQFELDAVDVPEGGVVVAAEDRLRAVSGVLKQLQDLGFSLTDFADSAIAGKSGNVEVFVWARRAS